MAEATLIKGEQDIDRQYEIAHKLFEKNCKNCDELPVCKIYAGVAPFFSQNFTEETYPYPEPIEKRLARGCKYFKLPLPTQ